MRIRRHETPRFGALLIWVVTTFPIAHADAVEPLRLLPSEPATEQSAYEARLNRRGVHDVDPNVYVYTPEFAKRFQLPMEWASEELKGADAVAFRVVPTYKSCGWGGNPKACREDEVRCDMDVYFDHQRNPLPWDERMRPTDLDRSTSSLAFIGNIANPFVRPKGKHIERIKTADGLTMYDTDVEQFVQAMNAFAPPAATQTRWTNGQASNGQVLLTVSH